MPLFSTNKRRSLILISGRSLQTGEFTVTSYLSSGACLSFFFSLVRCVTQKMKMQEQEMELEMWWMRIFIGKQEIQWKYTTINMGYRNIIRAGLYKKNYTKGKIKSSVTVQSWWINRRKWNKIKLTNKFKHWKVIGIK